MSWRVAVTRDEPADGPLGAALRACGFITGACPVSEEQPPADSEPLAAAARDLEQHAWAIFSSRRAVAAITRARHAPWPRGLRTAAVGAQTAGALVAAGADPPPITARHAGAAALWAHLKPLASWSGAPVLVPAVAGGRLELIDGLRAAGAHLTVVEAYRMAPRAAASIAADWHAIAPDAVVVASPSVARALIDALGHDALASLRAAVVLGETTRAELEALRIPSAAPASAGFAAAARHLARLRDAAVKRAR